MNLINGHSSWITLLFCFLGTAITPTHAGGASITKTISAYPNQLIYNGEVVHHRAVVRLTMKQPPDEKREDGSEYASGNLTCSGTIIGNKHYSKSSMKILTARHCFVDNDGREKFGKEAWVEIYDDQAKLIAGGDIKDKYKTIDATQDVAVLTVPDTNYWEKTKEEEERVSFLMSSIKDGVDFITNGQDGSDNYPLNYKTALGYGGDPVGKPAESSLLKAGFGAKIESWQDFPQSAPVLETVSNFTAGPIATTQPGDSGGPLAMLGNGDQDEDDPDAPLEVYGTLVGARAGDVVMQSYYTPIGTDVGKWLSEYTNSIWVYSEPFIPGSVTGLKFNGLAESRNSSGAPLTINVCLKYGLQAEDFIQKTQISCDSDAETTTYLCRDVTVTGGEWQCASSNPIDGGSGVNVGFIVASYSSKTQPPGEGRVLSGVTRVKVYPSPILMNRFENIYPSYKVESTPFFSGENSIYGVLFNKNFELTFTLHDPSGVEQYFDSKDCLHTNNEYGSIGNPDPRGRWQCEIPNAVLSTLRGKTVYLLAKLKAPNNSYSFDVSNLEFKTDAQPEINFEAAGYDLIQDARTYFHRITGSNYLPYDKLYIDTSLGGFFYDVVNGRQLSAGNGNITTFIRPMMRGDQVNELLEMAASARHPTEFEASALPIVADGLVNMPKPELSVRESFPLDFLPPVFLAQSQDDEYVRFNGLGGAKKNVSTLQPYSSPQAAVLQAEHRSAFIVTFPSGKTKVKFEMQDEAYQGQVPDGGFNRFAGAKFEKKNASGDDIEAGRYLIEGYEGFYEVGQEDLGFVPISGVTPARAFRVNNFYHTDKENAFSAGAFYEFKGDVLGPIAKGDKVTLKLRDPSSPNGDNDISICETAVLEVGEWSCMSARLPSFETGSRKYKLLATWSDISGKTNVEDPIPIGRVESGNGRNNPFDRFPNALTVTSPLKDGDGKYSFSGDITPVFYGSFSNTALQAGTPPGGVATVSWSGNVAGRTENLTNLGDGRWKLTLDNLPASTEFQLTIKENGSLYSVPNLTFKTGFQVISPTKFETFAPNQRVAIKGKGPLGAKGEYRVVVFRDPGDANDPDGDDKDIFCTADVDDSGEWDCGSFSFDGSETTVGSLVFYLEKKAGASWASESTLSRKLSFTQAPLTVTSADQSMDNEYVFSGKAVPGSTVAVSIDNQEICTTTAWKSGAINQADADWSCDGKLQKAGRYKFIARQAKKDDLYNVIEAKEYNLDISGELDALEVNDVNGGYLYYKNQLAQLSGRTAPGSVICVSGEPIEQECDESLQINVTKDGVWKALSALNTDFTGSFPLFVKEFRSDGRRGTKLVGRYGVIDPLVDTTPVGIDFPGNDNSLQVGKKMTIIGKGQNGTFVCLNETQILSTPCAENGRHQVVNGVWSANEENSKQIGATKFFATAFENKNGSTVIQSTSWVYYTTTDDVGDATLIKSPSLGSELTQDDVINKKVMLSGVAKPFSTITVSPCLAELCEKTITADSQGAWSAGEIPFSLVGSYQFTVTSSENGERISESPAYYTITKPGMQNVELSEPFIGQIFTQDQVVYASGTAQIGASVCVTASPVTTLTQCNRNYVTVMPQKNGAWTSPLPLSTNLPGEYPLFVTAFINGIPLSQSMASYRVAAAGR